MLWGEQCESEAQRLKQRAQVRTILAHLRLVQVHVSRIGLGGRHVTVCLESHLTSAFDDSGALYVATAQYHNMHSGILRHIQLLCPAEESRLTRDILRVQVWRAPPTKLPQAKHAKLCWD